MTTTSASLSHDQIWELLPWFINGTLAEEERRQTEQHLRLCPACRKEASALEELAARMRSEEEIPLTADLSLRRPSTSRVGARKRSLVRLALLAQAATILVLLGLLLWPAVAPEPEPPLFRTLTDPTPETDPANGILLRVVFAEETTEAELRRLLLSLDGQLLGGPSERGVYTLELPRPESAERQRALFEALRASPLIQLAEPIAPSGPAAGEIRP